MTEKVYQVEQENGNLHTLIKPIKYSLDTNSEQEKENINNDSSHCLYGWDEIILLAHDNSNVHYMGVARVTGVFDRQEYCSSPAGELWDVIQDGSYDCQGFVDLDSKGAEYLRTV